MVSISCNKKLFSINENDSNDTPLTLEQISSSQLPNVGQQTPLSNSINSKQTSCYSSRGNSELNHNKLNSLSDTDHDQVSTSDGVCDLLSVSTSSNSSNFTDISDLKHIKLPGT